MEISKPIEVIPNKSWVLVYEHVNGSLVLEGATLSGDDTALIQRIRFSEAEIKKLLPAIKEWLALKKSLQPST